MGEKIDYFVMAENDYDYLKDDYERGKIGNIFCSNAQNVCEKYLKHLIDVFCVEVNTTDILRTHSLRRLKIYINKNIPEFECDWNQVLLADGYYFSARYPGDDAMLVEKYDVDVCWSAMSEVRKRVIDFAGREADDRGPEKIYTDA